ncbi:MAG: ComF family protein [Elusimicrobiota bacterium]
MKGVFWFLFKLFFPACCPGCKKDMSLCFNVPACSSCVDQFEFNRHLFTTKNLDSLHCHYLYKEPLRSFIIHSKYHAKDYLLPYLLDQVTVLFSGFDCVISVPGHPIKNVLRGYNPASLIASAISRKAGIPFKANFISRKLWSKSQKKLTKSERWENSQASFFIHKSIRKNCFGLKILLIDDVCTTSSTLEVCAKILKNQGAKEVHGWALCYEELQK